MVAGGPAKMSYYRKSSIKPHLKSFLQISPPRISSHWALLEESTMAD